MVFTFRTKQEVANFYSYERWLTAQGYDFDNRMEDFGTVKITANWLMSVKEFVPLVQTRLGRRNSNFKIQLLIELDVQQLKVL